LDAMGVYVHAWGICQRFSRLLDCQQHYNVYATVSNYEESGLQT